MSARKRKGDAAEAARQQRWEDCGAFVFPISPSYPGVDLVVFSPAGTVWLSEVKGQRRNLTRREIVAAADKLRKALAQVRKLVPSLKVKAELVHVRGEQHLELWNSWQEETPKL